MEGLLQFRFELVAAAAAVAAPAVVWAGTRCALRWKRSEQARVYALARRLAVGSVVNVPAGVGGGGKAAVAPAAVPAAWTLL